MMTFLRGRKKEQLQTAVLAIPLILFILLKLYPTADILAWRASWYTRLIQFYAGSFASLVAIIAAVFSESSVQDKSHPGPMFIKFAFVNISAMLFFSSIGTPEVILPDYNGESFLWSLRFAFPLGAIFFFLATIHWSEKTSRDIVQNRRLLWLLGIITLSTYGLIAFAYPEIIKELQQFTPILPTSLAVFSITLFIIAAWRNLKSDFIEDAIKPRLTVVLILLAEAQYFQTFGAAGRYSWLLYHPVMLAALMLAISAILTTLGNAKNVRFNQYFAVLGSILIGGLSLLIGEIGTRWVGPSVNRTSIVTLVLIQGALSFFVLFIIVMYLNRLINERTNALHREQHLRSELTQLIVHDLKSPLSVIISGINLLAKGSLGHLTETQIRLLSKLEKSGQHIIDMINDLLDVERLEAGALTLQMSNISIAKLVREVVIEHELIATNNKQTLRLLQPPQLPILEVDKRLLHRVLNNLVSNALKFTPMEGHIEISIEIDLNWLIIHIADDGPGVPEEDKERIFEKFSQVRGTERRGAGLGLTFCKMVTEAHDGLLTVSKSQLGGALFEMKLPIPLQPSIEADTSMDLSDIDLTLKAS
ncbi:MAG: HAMP domain-containing histidine kinase [Anaerolineales bacterium]|nr:HAMP domain-containing histidine kinase [Anaerolineales bacterium]